MGWTKQARQRVNPLGVHKGQVFKSTDDRPEVGHHPDYYVVERVSFVRGRALVRKCWSDPNGNLRPFSPSTARKTWVKLDRFTPKHHLRPVPDYTYRLAA